LKADAEAAMEKLAAGLKNRKWFALPIHPKRRRKASCSWKTVSVHYEGSLESEKF
jgi:hypothetical protein